MSLIKVSPSSHPQRRLLLKFAMTSSVFRSIDHILVRVRNAQQMLSLFAKRLDSPCRGLFNPMILLRAWAAEGV